MPSQKDSGLTSADILLILQAVESLLEQSADLVAPDSPIT